MSNSVGPSNGYNVEDGKTDGKSRLTETNMNDAGKKSNDDEVGKGSNDEQNEKVSNGRTSLGKRKASGGGEEEERAVVEEKKCRKWQETLKEDEETKKVYIWDLDETLIIFQSLLSGTFAQQRGIDVSACESAALEMEDLIVSTAENRFFFNELEKDGDRVHIHDVDEDVDDVIGRGEAAEDDDDDDNDDHATTSAEHLKTLTLRNRYRQIKALYEKTTLETASIFSDDEGKRKWTQLRDRVESLTERWVSEAATKCLSAVLKRRQKSVNVIVTNSQLIAAFVKLILNDLSSFFPAHNVYSSSKVGKEFCFSSIRERFPSASFVVIGDGMEEENAAEKMDFLFWKVSSKRDLNSLATAIDLNYM